MDKVINSYETLFIVNCENGEEAVKATVDKFTGLVAENGTIDSVNEWGKRRLAYPIEKINEGYYVLAAFNSNPHFPAELERLLGINDNILRSMTTRVEETATSASPAAAEEAPAAETVSE